MKSIFQIFAMGLIYFGATRATTAPIQPDIYEIPEYVVPCTFSSDGKIVAVNGVTQQSVYRLFDLENKSHVDDRKIPLFPKTGTGAKMELISADLQTAVYISRDMEPFILNYRTGIKTELKGYGHITKGAAFFENETQIVTVTFPGNPKFPRSLVIWDASTGQAIKAIDTELGHISSLAIPNGCDCVAVVGSSGTRHEVQFWSLKSYEKIKTISLPIDNYEKLKFSHDGNYMFVTGYNTMTVYDVATGSVLYTLSQAVNDLGISRDNRFLVLTPKRGGGSSPSRPEIQIVELKTGQVLQRFPRVSLDPNDSMVSPFAEWVVSRVEPYPRVRIWDLRDLIK